MEDSRKTTPGEVPCESPVCEQTLPHPEVVACVRAQMPDPEQQQRLADLFRMFGDASRIRILRHYSIPRCAYVIWLSYLG